jgi:hypothetical protein
MRVLLVLVNWFFCEAPSTMHDLYGSVLKRGARPGGLACQIGRQGIMLSGVTAAPSLGHPQNNTQLGFFFFRKEDAEALIEKVRYCMARLSRWTHGQHAR